jgi:hypothetical protein
LFLLLHDKNRTPRGRGIVKNLPFPDQLDISKYFIMIGSGMQAKVLGGSKSGEMDKFFYEMCLVKVAMIVSYGSPADVMALLLNSIQYFAEPV